MNHHQYCQFIDDNYTPFNPDLYTFHEDILAPEFVRAVRDKSAAAIKSFCQEVHPGGFVFDMCKPRFCSELLDEVACFETWCKRSAVGVVRPNSMNNYGAVLDTFGFQPFLQ